MNENKCGLNNSTVCTNCMLSVWLLLL